MSTINDGKKSRGRPTVDSEAVTVRVERTMLEKLDRMRAGISRPEAIRRLIAKGLDSE